MKLLGLILLLNSAPLLASPCKVYGISDSPQKLECTFAQNEDIALSCSEGVFYLNDEKVLSAYHLDVETGSSPLVFKTAKSSLIITKQKTHFIAERENTEGSVFGECR